MHPVLQLLASLVRDAWPDPAHSALPMRCVHMRRSCRARLDLHNTRRRKRASRTKDADEASPGPAPREVSRSRHRRSYRNDFVSDLSDVRPWPCMLPHSVAERLHVLLPGSPVVPGPGLHVLLGSWAQRPSHQSGVGAAGGARGQGVACQPGGRPVCWTGHHAAAHGLQGAPLWHLHAWLCAWCHACLQSETQLPGRLTCALPVPASSRQAHPLTPARVCSTSCRQRCRWRCAPSRCPRRAGPLGSSGPSSGDKAPASPCPTSSCWCARGPDITNLHS